MIYLQVSEIYRKWNPWESGESVFLTRNLFPVSLVRYRDAIFIILYAESIAY